MSKTLAVVAVLAGLTGTALADPPDSSAPAPAPDETAAPCGASSDTTSSTTASTSTTADTTPCTVSPTADVPAAPPPPTQTTSYDPNAYPQNSGYRSTTVVEDNDEGVSAYGWREPRLMSEIGVGIAIGGGVTGFTEKAMRDTMSNDVGGLWDARLSLGTHVPIGLEIGYVGSATSVNTFTGLSNGTLIGTTAEADLRLNLLPHEAFTPFIFGGLGYQRYDLHNVRFATSDTGMRTSDSWLEVPAGLGLSFRSDAGFTFDLRGTYRWQATDSTLVFDAANERFVKANTWEASGALGYEF